MVLHICARTRLNVQFAVDCLTNNGWDVEKAFLNFEQVKVSTVQRYSISVLHLVPVFHTVIDSSAKIFSYLGHSGKRSILVDNTYISHFETGTEDVPWPFNGPE